MEEEGFGGAFSGVLSCEFSVDGNAVPSNRLAGVLTTSFRCQAEDRLPLHCTESASSRYGLGCFFQGTSIIYSYNLHFFPNYLYINLINPT